MDGSGGDTALSPTAGLGGECLAGDVKPKRNDSWPAWDAIRPGSGGMNALLLFTTLDGDFSGSTKESFSSGGTSLMLARRAGVWPGSIGSRTGGGMVPDLVD